MYAKTKAIVLSAIKYGDSSRILRCYTREFGAQSYLINSVKSKKAAIKSSMILPLTQLQLEASHRDKGTLERIKEARVSQMYLQLHNDPIRNAVALFVAEVLGKVLKEEQSNPEKYDFVTESCTALDQLEKLPGHFHIWFLLQLSFYLGFYPDESSTNQGRYFDWVEGVFLPTPPLHPHYSTESVSSAIAELLKHKSVPTAVRFSREVRKEALHDVLGFYHWHVDGFGKLKSLEVLQEIFT